MSLKKNILLFLVLIFSVQFVHAEWKTYECNVLPENFTKYDSTFSEDQTDGGLDNDTADLLVLEEHPDEPGNMIIRVDADEARPGQAEMWHMPWTADDNPAENGATLVFRTKGINEGSRVHDLYIGNGQARERLTGRTNGNMEWNKADVNTGPIFRENYDIFEWHTFRITVSPTNQFKLYIDGNTDPVLLSLGGDSEYYYGWKFGDGGSDSYNALFDWFAWTADGAFAPGEGDPVPLDVEDDIANAPINYRLTQNYPNPFNPVTHISFSLKQEAPTNIKVYNSRGEHVETLVSRTMSPGEHTLEFNASDLPSGVYFYRISAGEFTQSKKMVLLK